MAIKELLVENVRCFHGCHTIEIRPLTLLVGENSTGKTSLLAALASFAGSGELKFPYTPNFNIPPFQMGRFEDIATYRGGAGGREEGFGIGVADDAGDRSPDAYPYSLLGRYMNDNGRPTLREFAMRIPPLFIYMRRLKSDKWEVSRKKSGAATSKLAFSLRDLSEQIASGIQWDVRDTVETPGSVLRQLPLSFWALQILLRPEAKEGENRGGVRTFEDLDPDFVRIINTFGQGRRGLYNLAPIRAVPQRTYESYKEESSPEGHHVPFVIERQSRGKVDSSLVRALEEFGHASDLFSDISVRRFGRPKGSRFAINIKVNGPVRNLADVGYGVAQVLPPVVDSLRLPKGTTITMQQPEVHLHPRAQAALGSLFAQIAVADKKNFIIETHSDYLVDRIRQEVARGAIRHTDVVIWFSELVGTTAELHKISVNKSGDIQRAPKSYRSFFADETLALLSRG